VPDLLLVLACLGFVGIELVLAVWLLQRPEPRPRSKEGQVGKQAVLEGTGQTYAELKASRASSAEQA
jgi:hypothetical protein